MKLIDKSRAYLGLVALVRCSDALQYLLFLAISHVQRVLDHQTLTGDHLRLGRFDFGDHTVILIVGLLIVVLLDQGQMLLGVLDRIRTETAGHAETAECLNGDGQADDQTEQY